MISRRSFIIVSSSTPLLTFFKRLSAEEVEHEEPLGMSHDEPVVQTQHAAFGIRGWQDEATQNESSTRFISLSASWKSGWL